MLYMWWIFTQPKTSSFLGIWQSAIRISFHMFSSAIGVSMNVFLCLGGREPVADHYIVNVVNPAPDVDPLRINFIFLPR